MVLTDYASVYIMSTVENSNKRKYETILTFRKICILDIVQRITPELTGDEFDRAGTAPHDRMWEERRVGEWRRMYRA